MFFKKNKSVKPAGGRGHSPGALVWRRLQHNRVSVWSLRVLYVLIFFAVFADFVANEKPIYCKIDGRHQFPILRQYAVDLGLARQKAEFVRRDWRNEQYESVLFAPIPYSATTPDIRNIYKGPFDAQKTESWRYRHWLGTDGLGHDLAASLLAGARVAILVGVVSMSIATLIGLLLGALAGYFGDDGFRISRGRLVLNGAGLLAGWFYAFQVRGYVLSEAIQHRGLGVELMKSLVLFAGIMALANGLVYFTKKIKWLKKRVGLPLDLLIMRAIEVVNSIPGLLLLLALVAVMPKSSILYVMVIIGLIRWQSIARFLRAELLRIRNLNYIEAGRALGYSHRRILFGHALPNAIGPVLITVAFGMASAVLLESALSFLGIGIGAEGMTWGRLLAGARHHPSAWWLALFPGGAIFITVTALNLLGEALSEE